MKKVLKEDFALLKDNLDIVDVISSYGIKVWRTGTTWTASCPFHKEKTPSFKIWPNSKPYPFCQCQGCKEGGSIIDFVMLKEGLKTASEAAISLSKRFDIPIRFEEKGVQEKTTEDFANEIILANEFALKSFQQQFKNTYHARKYMVERGYTKELVEKWEIGYASYDYTLDYDQESLKKAGLVIERDGKIANKFRGRIMFPIRDRTGRLVGFGGRILEESANTPKYLNSDESVVFKKREVLYGYYHAQKLIKEQQMAILVEGYTDVNLLDRANAKNVVGICGTSFTDEQAALICTCHSGKFNLYMIDNDTAGKKSAVNVIIKHWHKNIYCRILCPKDEGWDPAKAAVAYGADLIDHVEELCAIKILYDFAKGEREDKVEDVLSHIAILPNALKRHEMIEELSEVSGYPVKALSEAINKHIQKAVFYGK